MDGKPPQCARDIEQNTAELLPRNPYCSNEGTHCGCRLPHMTYQPQWVAAKPWSLWKTFLVCLLACLIATSLVVLVVYFVHFSKPIVIIHADEKPSHVTCAPGSSPSPAPIPTLSPTPFPAQSPTPFPAQSPAQSPAPTPAPSTLHGSQGTLPFTPVTNQSSLTMEPPSAMKTTTLEHEIIIEDPESHF